MKKIILFFMFAALVIFAVSCSEDDSEDGGSTGNKGGDECNSNVDCDRAYFCDLENPKEKDGTLAYYCKKRQVCISQLDCPMGWKCKESEGFCITKKEAEGVLCRSNEDCKEPGFPVCNLANGECQPYGSDTGDTSDSSWDEPSDDSDNGDTGGSDEDETDDSDSAADEDNHTNDSDNNNSTTPVGAVLMMEDFEDGGSAWKIEAASEESQCWQVGVPSSGPEEAHGGSNVAATILDGDYPSNCKDLFYYDMALKIPDKGVPEISFYAWVDIDGSAYAPYTDYAEVLIKQEDDVWGAVTGLYLSADSPSMLTALDTTRTKITKRAKEQYYKFSGDLSAYKGKKVHIGFRFVSNGSAEASGFYLDDIKISY